MTSKGSSSEVRQLSAVDWPPGDAEALRAACASQPGPFGRRQLSFYTYRNYERSYGAFLWHLTCEGQLDPTEKPGQRITPERRDSFYEHLVRSGNANTTIVTRFEDLRSILQLMEPAGDFAFITRPGTFSIRQLLPRRPRVRFVPDSRHCELWAEALFMKALSLPFPTFRRKLVRDSAFLGILASRGPRLRAMMGMRLGQHLIRTGEGWKLFYDKPLMKGGKKTLELLLGSRVGAMVERYVTVERLELLRDQTHDFLWVARDGAPLCYNSAIGMVRLRTKKEFGVAFGPHRFRTSLTTTQAVIDGTDSLGVSLMLDHSIEIALLNYNRANALEASRRHDVRISEAEDAAARMLGLPQGRVSRNKPITSPQDSKRQRKVKPAVKSDRSGSPPFAPNDAVTPAWKRARHKGPQRD